MNYDEKAIKINEDLCVPCDCGQCVDNIASALRESAAQALAAEAQHWEDILRPGQEVSGSEIKARLWMVADQAMAAAIRAGGGRP